MHSDEAGIRREGSMEVGGVSVAVDHGGWYGVHRITWQQTGKWAEMYDREHLCELSTLVLCERMGRAGWLPAALPRWDIGPFKDCSGTSAGEI